MLGTWNLDAAFCTSTQSTIQHLNISFHFEVFDSPQMENFFFFFYTFQHKLRFLTDLEWPRYRV